MIKIITDIFEHQLQNYPQSTCLAGKKNGEWTTYNTQKVNEILLKTANGLMALGIQKGDKIALISNNRPEWNMLDLAILTLGAVNVPIYPTITDEDYTYILSHAEAKLLFVSNADLYHRLKPIVEKLPFVCPIYTFDEVEGATHWENLHISPDAQQLKQIAAAKASITPQDLATLIYTSGTTGTPKGVMLSHENITSNVRDSIERVPCATGNSALSFLPLCHSFERIVTYIYLYQGIQIWYAESMDTIADNLKEVQPQVFSSVPRLLEKVYNKIVEKGYQLTGLKKQLFFWALNLANQYTINAKKSWFYVLQLNIANKLIFSKWREALGGNVACIVTGAAALQPRLAKIFWAAQIPVVEGYGLTETSPVIAVNYLKKMEVKAGTVGTVIQNVKVRIAEDGEILCKGPNVMMGYYKRPDLTQEVIDQEGWLHTGDIGKIDHEGFLKITDRKKEIFKTSGGKYIAPQALENKLKESTLIDQPMVVGENQKFPAALLTLNWETVEKWCLRHEIAFDNRNAMVNNDLLIAKVKNEVEKVNQQFGAWEQIKKFEILPDSWSIQTGEMTPTLKLKRKVILEKNRSAYDRIYSDNQ